MDIPALVNPIADKATPAISGAAKPAAKPTPTPITATCTLDSPSPSPLPPAEFALLPMLSDCGIHGLSILSSVGRLADDGEVPVVKFRSDG